MSKDMRGLTQYIADLRACRVRELEEKRVNKEMAHIRQKFKEGSLDGYQRKKYLSKIVFTYILGYQVDIGHMEAVNLVSSSKYSEKQIGYLALTLLMHENDDLVRLVVNSIRKDIDSLDEVHNCLALHAIANIGGREMADALAPDVHKLLISPTSKSFVKKKAALTLLRLYRKYPDCIEVKEWALRIVSIMDDYNLGVALSVTSLVTTLAQDNLEDMAVCYQKAVHRLHKIVVDQEYTAEYVYYRIPIPWLQVKLLRLLQYYPPSDDSTIRQMLHSILKGIIDSSQETPKNIQHNNAQNAVLFEAISLAIHVDTESSIVTAGAALLGRFILSRETNVRYLGMDTMAHLATRSENLEAVKKYQDTVILSLKDRDVSVRRRALDLLYSMCDGTNAKTIVGELLKFLTVADYTLREEMVLKIAILTEKFATEYEWYFDTILRLMSIAGDYVGDEVWYRIVQIVTNTEELQEYASRKVYEHLRSPTCHENIVKVAAYILGEFGHLIANEEDPKAISPIEQFTLINSKVSACSSSTKALILTTYVKWLNLFPEIRQHIIVILQKFTHTLDAELQQRACEYLAIASMPDEDMLQNVMDEMPPFPESRESALLNRLLRQHSASGDKRTWVAGEREGGRNRSESDATRALQNVDKARRKAVPMQEDGHAGLNNGDEALAAASAAAINVQGGGAISLGDVMDGATTGSVNANGTYYPPDDIMAGLAGLDLSSNPSTAAPTPSATVSLLGPSSQSQADYMSAVPNARSPSSSVSSGNVAAAALIAGSSDPAGQAIPPPSQSFSMHNQLSSTSAKTTDTVETDETATSAASDASATTPVAGMASTSAAPVQFTHGTDKFLPRLAYNSEGVLWEDTQLQIGVKSEYHGSQGRLALYFGNKISAPFTSFTLTVTSQEPNALSVVLPKLPPSTLHAATQIQQIVQLEAKALFTRQPVLSVSYLAGSLQSVTLPLPVWLNKFVEPVSLNQAEFFERWKQMGGPPREAQVVFPLRLTSSGNVDLARHRRVVKGLRMGVLDGIDPNANNIVAAGMVQLSSGKIGCLIRLEPNKDARLCRLTIRSVNGQAAAELLQIVQEPLQGSASAKSTPLPSS